MLTYLIYVTGDLFTVSCVLGAVIAFAASFFTEKGRRVFAALLAFGFIIAGVRAYITNTRRLVGGWKVGIYGYTAALILFVLLIAALIIYSKSGRKPVSEIILASVAGLLMAAFIYGAVPNVYVYPFQFDIGDSSILSTDYLFRLGGYLLGLIVCFTAGLATFKIARTAAKKGYDKVLYLLLIAFTALYTVFSFAKLMLVLVPRKIVNSMALFTFAASSNNHSAYYTYIAFIILLAVGVFLWVRGRTVKEVYTTNAQHRRQRAEWRTGRRYTVTAAVCFVVSILCATWFVKLNTVEIHEAPVEEPEIKKNAKGEDDTLIVPVDAVSDGHLHRFGYKADGHTARFIIVLKQEGTTNYGVGLDACDICGEAGYYENKEGQIVCKKCNVVMNRSTIGMKGGCNPIIIDYEFDGQQFTVPVSEMVQYADKFTQ